MSDSFISQELGDWHAFTWDGREVVISNVNDPHRAREYTVHDSNYELPFYRALHEIIIWPA